MRIPFDTLTSKLEETKLIMLIIEHIKQFTMPQKSDFTPTVKLIWAIDQQHTAYMSCGEK